MNLSCTLISDTSIPNASVSINDILKSITDGFVALDHHFIVRMWNDAAEELLDLPRSFVLGKNILSDFPSLPELYNSSLIQHLKRSLGDNITISTEQYVHFRDKWFDARIHPYKDGLLIYFKDVTTRKKQDILLEKLLKQEIDKHKMVARAVVDAQEKERAEIGKELHDNVNQILSTAKLFLEVAKTDAKERLSLIKRSAQSIHDAINEIRSLSKSLVPPSISDLGLTESINDLIQNIHFSKALKVDFFIQGDVENGIDGNLKLMLFRIIQEQVNNVLKHSLASLVSISIEVNELMVELEITDDGRGFDMEKTHMKKGVGLTNIISRAELFHGKVDIYTSPGEGCKLKVEIPIMNL